MRRSRLVLALVAAAMSVACTGHYTEPFGPPADAAIADACLGALYDPCMSDSECESGVCKDYTGAGFEVCTEACVYCGPTCLGTCGLDSTGQGRCNMMGLCRPDVANPHPRCPGN